MGHSALEPGKFAANHPRGVASSTAVSLARSLGRGVARLRILFSRDRFMCFFFGLLLGQAPAIQLVEHAQAILADDAANGFARRDPVLKRIARGNTNAATCQHFGCSWRCAAVFADMFMLDVERSYFPAAHYFHGDVLQAFMPYLPTFV